MKFRLAAVLLSAFFLQGLVAPAQAGEPGASDWFETPQSSARLISATDAVDADGTLQLGLEFTLRPGWKIYWRSPGDAGFPPRVRWAGSKNLAETTFGWPAPERFSVVGLETTGYKRHVVFPIAAMVENSAAGAELRATVDFLTCDDICIPYKTNLSLDLPAGDAKPTAHFQTIGKFAAKVPGDGSAQGIALERAELAGELSPSDSGGREGVIRVIASARTPFSEPDVFVEGPPELVFAKPELSLVEDDRRVILRVPVSADGSFEIAGRDLRFTLVDGDRAAERALTVMTGVPGTLPSERPPLTRLFVILGLALAGGLILNLMPCVLPVLSLKIVGAIGHGGKENGAVRAGFVATAAGIVFSFLVLAAGLVALKSAGAAVGWGIQFQQPWFLVTMTLVVSLFAYSMWGMFEIRPSAALTSVAGTVGGPGLAGNFVTGAFATLLATPCSAPFLGTAVGFALSRGPGEIFAVFTALGVGMAAPFLAVAVFPRVATQLPKPGAWMVRIRYLLGIALAATAVWLLWVIAMQLGDTVAWILGGLTAAIGLALLVRRRIKPLGGAAVGAAAALALAAYMVPPLLADSGGRTTTAIEGHWQKFDLAAIPKLVADGKVVLVDVTADWCITCQVNKASVLNRGKVLEFLKSPSVVAMKADWTRPDDEIASFLKSFGRYGIPFNVVYGPDRPAGVALPELLSTGAVLSAFDEAGKRTGLAGN
jgi:suppressor for copper-sensitivity B